MTFNEPFESIDAARLLSLIDNGVPESATLEYKRQSYGPKDGKELAKDVSALANTLGGDLFIGIEEKDGIAAALTPLPADEADKETLRLESIIKTTIDPALVGLRMQRIRVDVEGDGGVGAGGEGEGVAGEGDGPPGSGDGGDAVGEVIHIRVPRSFTPPHRVTAQGSNRFFGRHSAGVSELTMPDLRRLFGQERDMYDRARAFIGERFLKVQAGDTPVPVKLTGSGLVMHLVPLMDFAQGRQIDVREIKGEEANFPTMGGQAWSTQINIMGLVRVRGESEANAYTQVFRDGSIEAIRTKVVVDRQEYRALDGVGIGHHIHSTVRRCLNGLISLGSSGPMLLQARVLGTAETILNAGQIPLWGDELKVTQDSITLPVCTIASAENPEDLDLALRRQLDVLWNAYGAESCPHFDDDGRWVPPH